jgi:hypothetical protein
MSKPKPQKKIAKRTAFPDVVTRLISERDPSTLLWAAEGLTTHAVEARKVAKRLGVKLPKIERAPKPLFGPDCEILPPKYADPDETRWAEGRYGENVYLLNGSILGALAGVEAVFSAA